MDRTIVVLAMTGIAGIVAPGLIVFFDARKRGAKISVSILGVAVGVLFLFPGYFWLYHHFNDVVPLAARPGQLTFARSWHCGLVLTALVTVAGYVGGRVSRHDRELTGALTGLSFTLYIAIMKLFHEDFRIAGEIAVESLQPFLMAPGFGFWGGFFSARNPWARFKSLVERPAAAARRRQKEAQAQSGYKLVMLNDDKTPMEFVVEILERFFGMTPGLAASTMLHIHNQGRAIAAIYQHQEAAEMKLAELTAFIGSAGQPLRCVMEPSPS